MEPMLLTEFENEKAESPTKLKKAPTSLLSVETSGLIYGTWTCWIGEPSLPSGLRGGPW